MSVDTRAYFKDVDSDDVAKIIDVFSLKFSHEDLSDSHDAPHKFSRIEFDYKEERRMMYVREKVIDVKADMAKWKAIASDTESGIDVDEGLPDKSEGVTLSLGYWGHSVEIMKLLAYYFNGYIDDCDAEDYYFVEKDFHEFIRLII